MSRSDYSPLLPLKEKILIWLREHGFTIELADWQTDAVFRMRVYGEFQQCTFPSELYDNLGRADSSVVAKAREHFCDVLQEDFSKSEFVERVDQIKRALRILYRDENLHSSEIEGRWPILLVAPVVTPAQNTNGNYYDMYFHG